MAWRWWPLGSLRLRRHTTTGVPRKRSGPPPPRARGRPLVSLRAGSRQGGTASTSRQEAGSSRWDGGAGDGQEATGGGATRPEL